jgi:cytochrome c oxidase subunit 3
MSTTIAHGDGHHQSGYELNTVAHPYHLVRPSIWPLVGAICAGALATGALLFMHGQGFGVLIAAFVAVLAMMFGWWRSVIHEAVTEHAHTPVVKVGLRFGMMLFIASEVMFFAAFFWAYFDASLFPADPMQYGRMAVTGGHWPPEGITPVDPFHLPLLMTLILLLSGTTVTWAHHAILEGKRREAARALGITVILGICFTGVQLYEYLHSEVGFREGGIFSSTFFMATGFHGFHVIVGTIFLAVCFFRTLAGHFTPRSHFGFEAAAWYWHFVDVVWLFLFVAVYWWGSAGATAVAH